MFRAVSGFTVKLRGSYKDLSIDPLSPFPCCCCCCQVASVVSDSVRPHRQQTTRLPCPWDSPGKNTGVSCHFLLQCMKVKSESEVTQSCPTVSDPMDCSLPGSSVYGIFQARVVEWVAIAFSVPLPHMHNILHPSGAFFTTYAPTLTAQSPKVHSLNKSLNKTPLCSVIYMS